MKKYRVEVTETVLYFIDLEAEDEDQARELAENAIVDDGDRDKWCTDVLERDTGEVYLDPPLWEKNL